MMNNPDSWIIPYFKDLVKDFSENQECSLLHDPGKIVKGDILVLLGCKQIFKDLHLNKHNLVVHESDLPKGRGWSPLTWQILEGKNEIPVALFEAVEEVDAGPIYFQEVIKFRGDELVDELREKQAEATEKLIKKFIENSSEVTPIPQKGEPTYCPKRTPKDSELDIEKTQKISLIYCEIVIMSVILLFLSCLENYIKLK